MFRHYDVTTCLLTYKQTKRKTYRLALLSSKYVVKHPFKDVNNGLFLKLFDSYRWIVRYLILDFYKETKYSKKRMNGNYDHK